MNRFLTLATLSLALTGAQAQQIVGSWQFDGNFNAQIGAPITLLAVLFNFGVNDPCIALEDLNRDGVVDDADLLLVLFNFGSGC